MNYKPLLISVIIPAYNGEKFLRDAVESIQQQMYQPLEIIIVDDGSTDETAEVAATFGEDVRYVYQSNRGLPGARNKGLEEARGDFIGFLDVDDLWTENKLRVQLEHFGTTPNLDIVLGRTQKIQMLSHSQIDHSRFKPWLEPAVALSMGSALFKKRVFERVGAFVEGLPFCCDWDWFMRARELGVSMAIHQEVVQYYRRHENNMTERIDEGNHDTLMMLKKSLNRRRQTNHDGALSLPKLSKIREIPTESYGVSER